MEERALLRFQISEPNVVFLPAVAQFTNRRSATRLIKTKRTGCSKGQDCVEPPIEFSAGNHEPGEDLQNLSTRLPAPRSGPGGSYRSIGKLWQPIRVYEVTDRLGAASWVTKAIHESVE